MVLILSVVLALEERLPKVTNKNCIPVEDYDCRNPCRRTTSLTKISATEDAEKGWRRPRK